MYRGRPDPNAEVCGFLPGARQGGKSTLVKLLGKLDAYAQKMKPAIFGVPELCEALNLNGELDEVFVLTRLAVQQGYIHKVQDDPPMWAAGSSAVLESSE